MFGKDKNSNPRIWVHIKQDPVDKVVRRVVEKSSDGTKAWVTIEKPVEGKNPKAGWKVDVTGCIRPSEKGLYCEVIRGAEKAIKIDVENKLYTFSKLTNDQMKEFVQMNIFKAHYGKLLGDLLSAIRPWLIILAITVVISIAIGGYNAYSISKIPAIAVQVAPTPTPPVVIG